MDTLAFVKSVVVFVVLTLGFGILIWGVFAFNPFESIGRLVLLFCCCVGSLVGLYDYFKSEHLKKERRSL